MCISFIYISFILNFSCSAHSMYTQPRPTECEATEQLNFPTQLPGFDLDLCYCYWWTSLQADVINMILLLDQNIGKSFKSVDPKTSYFPTAF